MAEQPDTNAALWKSEEVVKAFVAQGRERQRAEQLALVARLLPFTPSDTFTFLDLGAGTGAASRAVLAEYPNATALLGDFSEQMMAAGHQQMKEYDGRYRYVELDMHASTWPDEIPARLDAVISALSIHHLPDERKRGIFRQIFERLAPGAWYINFDPIRAPNADLETMWQRVNDRYDPEDPHRRTHRTPLEQARYENHVRYMIPLAPQLDWLREAGFLNVEVFWKRLDWVIYGGQRPA
ncbi:MAG: methyltransferase domain-containing protein [Chloroflexi bacterium]|nr:methyltransferase domain-containing protein [Chloroflexota bacterium]